jgi:hypothetical protein
MALQPFVGPGLFFSLVIFTQTVGLLGQVMSPTQGRYLHTGQHKHKINSDTDIHALSGIRTHDTSVRASEDGSCLRTRGLRDRLYLSVNAIVCNLVTVLYYFRQVCRTVIIFITTSSNLLNVKTASSITPTHETCAICYEFEISISRYILRLATLTSILGAYIAPNCVMLCCFLSLISEQRMTN